MTKRVLVIDDAFFMRNLLKNKLKEGGYEVIGEASDGKDGIIKYFDLKPDIVTMDIDMPNMDGIEATQEILSKDPEAKIVAVTGHNEEEIKEKALQAGMIGYLTKPFQPAFLWRTLENALIEPEVVEEPDTSAEETPDTENPLFVEEEEDEVFDILSEPEIDTSETFVIENEDDVINFPTDYQEEVARDTEKYRLSEDAPLLEEEAPEASESPTVPTATHHAPSPEESKREVDKKPTPFKGFAPEPKRTEPVNIRPPRQRLFTPVDKDTTASNDVEEPVLNETDETPYNDENKSFLSTLKGLFKK